MKRFTFLRLFGAILLSTLFSFLGLVAYQISDYYKFRDDYSGHIVRQDESAARDGLKDLQYFYEQNKKLDKAGLSWVIEEELGLFNGAECQRASFYNLTKNYGQTISELADKEGFCEAFLRGTARWRQAQAVFANASSLPEKTAEQKEKKMNQMKLADEMAATLVKDDFAAALKANPGHLPSSWNYDLMSDPKKRAAALMPKPGKKKILLNQPGGGPRKPGPRGEDDKKGEGNKSKDIDTDERAPGQPGGKPVKVG